MSAPYLGKGLFNFNNRVKSGLIYNYSINTYYNKIYFDFFAKWLF